MPYVPPPAPLSLESSSWRYCLWAGWMHHNHTERRRAGAFQSWDLHRHFRRTALLAPGKNRKPKSGWWRPSTSTGRYLTIKGMQCLVHHPVSSGLVAMESPRTELLQNNWRCVAHNDRYLTQGGLTVTILSPLTPILLKWLPLHLVILTLSNET